MGTDASIERRTRSYGRVLFVGFLGAVVLGALGAVAFAAFVTATGWFVGFVGLAPPAAAGLGMGVGVRERGGILTGVLAALVGVAMLVVGYVLIDWWLPPLLTYDFGALDLVIIVVGAYVAYRMGTGTDDTDEDDDTADA